MPDPVPRALTLLLDLDGTLIRSDEPVLEYGRRVAGELSAEAGAALLATLTSFLEEAGEHRRTPPLADADDGYQAVEALAAAYAVPKEAVDAAYAQSRRSVDVAGAVEPVPAGLLDLLAEIRKHVRVVVVTNAPITGVRSLLAGLGVEDLIDELVTDADKPTGLTAIVERFLHESGAADDPRRLLSVGDIWANDLAVPHARGCRTAYVDRFDRRRGPADASAPELAGLLDFIRAWAADATRLVQSELCKGSTGCASHQVSAPRTGKRRPPSSTEAR